jgi:hypothetical protein
MDMRALALAGAMAIGLSGGAQAAVVLYDTFDAETQALNYSVFDPLNVQPFTAFTNWNITAGTVDLIGAPSFFNFYPGNGNYVDLDGSTPNQNPAGQMTTKAIFGAGTYTLAFNLGGSTQGDINTVRVAFGDFSQDITLASDAGLTTQNFVFTTTGGQLSFTNLGQSDNTGLILDNVQLSSAVPEPATWAMMLIGFAGLAFAGARRRREIALTA